MTPADRLLHLSHVARQLEAVLSAAEADAQDLEDRGALQRANWLLVTAGDLVHRLVASIDEGIEGTPA